MTVGAVLVDGTATDLIPVSDSAVVRGDGCFEALRVYGGHPFRLDAHLERLARSAEALDLDPPDADTIKRWVFDLVDPGDESILRIMLTRGSAVAGRDDPGRCILMTHPVGEPIESMSLFPLQAPWHSAGRPWDLAGAKTLSYAPNMAAIRRAQAQGFDDALLLDDRGAVLEGPTYSVAWVDDGVIFTPSLDLGILDSITRRVMLAVADEIEVREVIAPIGVVLEADEVLAMSTRVEVASVDRIGDDRFDLGAVTQLLVQRFAREVRRESELSGS